jgi:hypothetical protein
VNPSLRHTIRAGLVFPLLLVGVLAGGLGFAAGRAVYPHEPAPRISTVTTNAAVPTATPATPATPQPPATSAPQQPSSGSQTSDNCPAGCECRHPSGGIVIVCHGGSAVRIP